MYLDNSSLCCSPCTYLHYRCLCCTWNCIHTLPELHLDLSSLQSPVLHMDGFPLYRALIRTLSCLDNSSLHVLLLDLSTVYKLQRPVLHSDVSTCWGLSFTWTCLHCRFMCCTWTCFLYRGLISTGCVHTTESCAAPGCVYTSGAEFLL